MSDESPMGINVGEGASIPDYRETRLVTAWSISLVGAIGLLVYMVLTYPDVTGVLLNKMPAGVVTTFQVTICAILVALPIGFIAGLGRLSENRVINLIASTYVEVIRGIPLLVQLFFIFYALSWYLDISEFVAAVVGLGFCFGAYIGEIFRAGICAVNKGQIEAARSLGFNRFQTMLYVTLPQAFRIVLPPLGNECIAMLKDTALISIVGLQDMTFITKQQVAVDYDYFRHYAVLGLCYLIITLILSKCVSMVEAKLAYDK